MVGVQVGDASGQGFSLIWKNPFVLKLALTAGIGGLLFGYDTGVISGALLYIREDFDSVDRNVGLQETIVSMVVAGAIIGAGFGGWFNDRFGRRTAILAGDLVFSLGAIVMAVAPNPVVLIVGRFLVGLGVGVASITSPLYISEISPPEVRGSLISLNGVLLTGGQFLSYLINYFLTKAPGTWRWMLGVCCIPAILQFILMFFLPESPRWLYRKQKQERALEVLKKIYSKEQLEIQLKAIQESIEVETDQKRSLQYSDLWRTKEIRLALVAGVGLQVLQQFSGINTLMYYSPTIVQFAGFASKSMSLLLSLVTSGVNVLGTILCFFILDKAGRKKILLFSLAGMVLSLGLLGGTFQYSAMKSPLVSRSSTMVFAKNTTCPAYKSTSVLWKCKQCLSAKCGFCAAKGNEELPGACLASDSFSQDMCKKTSRVWYENGCPTKIGWLAVLSMGLYIITYAPGMGTIPWVVNAEIYPTKYNGVCSGIAATANWICNLIVAQTFLTMTHSIGTAAAFFFFCCVSLVGLLFVQIFVPETKGLTFEQVEKKLKKRAQNPIFALGKDKEIFQHGSV